MRPTTLCFPKRGETYVLGCKKRGFGEGKYNGFGGKRDEGETFRQCMVRELMEEAGLLARPEDFAVVALFDFQFPYEKELSHIGYVYTIEKFQGIPLESEEMTIHPVTESTIPYESMWEGDKVWLPRLLKGEKLVGTITFGDDNSTVTDMKLVQVKDVFESESETAINQYIETVVDAGPYIENIY